MKNYLNSGLERIGKLILSTGLILFGFTVQAQMQVSLIFSPPYSPYFSDYLQYENKGFMTVVDPAFVNGNSKQVYLIGNITGDNGVSLKTKPGYKPGSPVFLNSSNPVTTLKGSDFADIFSWDNMTVTGTSVQKLVQNDGLPEGNYTICIQVFDYATDAPLSNSAPQGCCIIGIKHVEPPVPITPVCENDVYLTKPQNVVFSWSYPIGAPPGAKYILRIVPLINPSQNPTDALNTITTPPFFEKELNITTYVYNITDPILLADQDYAWRVIAYDPLNKVLFRNNGVSAACVFKTKNLINNPSPDISAPALFLATPDCSIPKKDSTVVSVDDDFTITWHWKTKSSTGKDSVILDKQPLKDISIFQYQIKIKALGMRGTKKNKADDVLDKSFYVSVDNPLLKTFTVSDCDNMGLKHNYWYEVEVIALDFYAKNLGNVKCQTRYLKKVKNTIPTVSIKGKLRYVFEGFPEKTGANFVSLKCEIVDAEAKNNSQISNGGVAYSAVCKTDKDGNFNVQVPDKINITKKYLRIDIQNSYYVNFTKNFALFNTSAPAGQPILYGDTLNLPDLEATVYKNKLRVNVAMGFPDFFYDTLNKSYNYNTTFSIDSLTIKPKSKIPGNIQMVLYRLSKNEIIPQYEGQGTKKMKWEGENIIVVAEGNLQKETVGGIEKSFVYFDRLLPSFYTGDEYFLKAKFLPKNGQPDNADIKTEDLDAPILKVKIEKPIKGLQSNLISFTSSIEYRLISNKPPISKIKGKLVYVWASDATKQVRPLANVQFSVVNSYLVNGKPFRSFKGGCKGEIHALLDNTGKEIPVSDQNTVVGVGTTDENGNFELEVININTKGVIASNGQDVVAASWNKCDEKQTKDPNKENPIEEIISQIYDPWDQGFDNGGIFENDYDDGMNFDNNMGQNFQPGSNQLLNGASVNVNGLQGGNLTGGMKGMNKGMQGVGGGMPAENSSDGDEATAEALGGENGSIKRIFQINIEGEHTSFYADPVNTSAGGLNEIVCQAFDTKDIGVFTSTVKEMTTFSPEILGGDPNENILEVKVYKKKYPSGSEEIKNFNLATAKFVVFRAPNTNTSLFPKGEGSITHPFKPLVQSKLTAENIEAYSGHGDIDNNLGKNFEWVIDHPVDIGSGSSVNFNNKSLLNTMKANYYVELTPDPAQGQIMFKPVITYSGYSYVNIYLSASRIAGRILDMTTKNTTQKGLSNAFIMIKNNTKNIYYFLSADENGYYELLNQSFCGSKFVYWEDNNNFTITVIVSGYKIKSNSTTINAIGQQRIIDFQMEPSRTFSANIKDEKGNGVVSFVMRNDSSIYKTNGSGVINNMPLEDKTGIQVTIIPQDVKYFEETITINDKGNIFINPVTVKERLHRMRFIVKNAITNEPLNGINIEIDNDKKCKTWIAGAGQMAFYNVSVNNYTVTISDPNGNFIPKKIQLSNKESKDYITYTIFLEQGMELTGNVTMDGNPVKNAKVYIDIKKSKYQMATDLNTGSLQTRTNSQGNYKIKGVPTDMVNLVVKATLDTSFAVSGDSKPVEVLPPKNNTKISLKPTNLELVSFKDLVLDKVFKYPFEIEKIVSKSNEYLVTGLIDFTGNYNGYSGSAFDAKPQISQVPFVIKNEMGKKYLVPKSDNFKLEVYSLKMTFLDKMNVTLTGQSDDKLVLEKDNNDGGVVRANTKIVDNSFDYPSSYLSFVQNNEFYFCADGSTPNTYVMTLSSTPVINMGNKVYNICNKQKKGVQYKFIGFDAQSDVSKCFIDKNAKLHLNGKMSCKMAKASQGTISLEIDEIILSDNKIEVPPTGKPLEIKLEDWTLQVKNWTMSPEKGGLNSSNCLLKTGTLDIPVGEFTLTNKFYFMDKFSLQNLSLGGGVLQLTGVNAGAASLVFDEKTGSDMSAHWKLVIAGTNGQPAAKINDVMPYLDKPLEIEYIQLLSKANESLITLKNSQSLSKLWNNQYVKFKPEVLASGDGYAGIAGTVSFEVARMNPIAAQFIFTKQGGNLKMDVNPVKVEFEGKGYAKFISSDVEKPKISNGLFEITGTVGEPNKFNPIPAWLKIGTSAGVARIYLPNNGVVGSPLATNYHLNLTEKSSSPSSSGNNLKISNVLNKNGMYISGNDWTTLKFSGNLIEGTPGSGKKYVKESNVMDFEVYGEIQANSDKLEVGETTPFGDFKMSYDFANSRLIGTLHCTQKSLGDNLSLEGADFEMCFEPAGWYLLGSGKLNTGTFLVEGMGIFNAGFLLGKHEVTQAMNNVVTKYSRSNTACIYLDANKSTFSGFFFTGGWDVLDKEYDYNFGLAWGGVSAYLGVDATFALNFASPSQKFFLAGCAMGKVEASLGSIVGTEICAGLAAELHGQAYFSTISNLTINGGASIKLVGCIRQWTPFGDVEAGVDLQAGIDLYLKPAGSPRFEYDCYLGPAKSSNTDACKKEIQMCPSCN